MADCIIISAGILAYLFSSGRQVFQPVISHCLSQMQAGSLAFVNSMGTHGHCHLLYRELTASCLSILLHTRWETLCGNPPDYFEEYSYNVLDKPCHTDAGRPQKQWQYLCGKHRDNGTYCSASGCLRHSSR